MKNPIIPLAGTLCVIGLFSLTVNKWVGGILIFTGLAIVGATVYFGRRTKATKQTYPVTIKTVSCAYEVQAPADDLVVEAKPSVPKPDHSNVGILLGALRSTGINTNAPIVEGGSHPITIRDVVVEVARVTEEKGKLASDLVPKMAQVYDRMWEHVAPACEKHGADTASLVHYIAQNAVMDVQGLSTGGADIDPAALI